MSVKYYTVDILFFQDGSTKAFMCSTDKPGKDEVIEITKEYERYRLYYDSFAKANNRVQEIQISNMMVEYAKKLRRSITE